MLAFSYPPDNALPHWSALSTPKAARMPVATVLGVNNTLLNILIPLPCPYIASPSWRRRLLPVCVPLGKRLVNNEAHHDGDEMQTNQAHYAIYQSLRDSHTHGALCACVQCGATVPSVPTSANLPADLVSLWPVRVPRTVTTDTLLHHIYCW